MSVLGGIGILAGPLIGAFYIIGIPEFLPLDSAGLAAQKLGWLILILYVPGGIAALVRPIRDRIIGFFARGQPITPAEEPVDPAADGFARAPSLIRAGTAGRRASNGDRGDDPVGDRSLETLRRRHGGRRRLVLRPQRTDARHHRPQRRRQDDAVRARSPAS